MNTEDFVTYEQAVTLKKLLFREDCLYHYDEGKLCENTYNSMDDVYISDFYQSSNSEDPYYCQKYEINEVDAPTLSQVQKWLIKEKLYYVQPDPDYSDAWYFDIINLKNNDLIHIWDIPDQPNIYNSYEEALSAGITECLKLLENNQ